MGKKGGHKFFYRQLVFGGEPGSFVVEIVG